MDIQERRELRLTSGGVTSRESAGETESMPLYQRIVQALQSEIVLGKYPVGTHLPSESELTRRFAVSRHTVRSALRALQDAGLVKSHQGLGTLVQRPSDGPGYVHRINTISDLFPVGAITRHDPVDGMLVDVPERAHAWFPDLGDERAWLRITGERSKPGADTPFNEHETYIAARFAGVGRVIGTSSGSIYAILETIYGEIISEVEQIIGGFTADGVIGARIGLSEGAAGIEVRRIHRVSSTGEIGILSFNRYPIEEYTFSMIMRRGSA